MKNMFKAGTLILLAMTLLLGFGCYNPTYERLIEAPLLPPPTIEPVSVTVGVYYSPEFKTYEHRQVFTFYSPGAIIYEEQTVTEIISLGSASVALFDQIFKSLFENTVTLENKPTYGKEIPGVDIIIEPSIGRYNLVYPWFPSKPKVEIQYLILLFSPHEGNIGSWSVEGTGEKKMSLPKAFVWPKDLTQLAMREAAAKFFIGFYDNAGVQKWLQGLNEQRENAKTGNK
jgi:hypothetical protein